MPPLGRAKGRKVLAFLKTMLTNENEYFILIFFTVFASLSQGCFYFSCNFFFRVNNVYIFVQLSSFVHNMMHKKFFGQTFCQKLYFVTVFFACIINICNFKIPRGSFEFCLFLYAPFLIFGMMFSLLA